MVTRFAKWLPVGLVAAGFTLLGAPRDARAVLVLEGTIQVDGSAPVTVFASDNNSLTGSAPAGAIILTDVDLTTPNTLTLAPGAIVPGYSVGSSSSFDLKALANNQINSNALQIVNTTGQTVTTNIAVGDNGFVGPANQAIASGGGTFSNATGSTYSIFFYNDPSNAQFLNVGSIPGTLIASHAFTGSEAPGLNNTVSFNSGPLGVNDPDGFGMALRFNFSLVNGGTFVSRGQNEFKTNVVPEPSTLAMAGMGGLTLLGFGWRRRRQLAA